MLRLVACNSHLRRDLAKDRGSDRQPPRLALLVNPEMMDGREPILSLPVADGLHADAAQGRDRLVSAKGTDKLGHGLDIHNPHSCSARLKMSRVLNTEKTKSRLSARFRGMFYDRSTEAIGKRLKATRLALELNATVFCQRAGISNNRYSQWEGGKHPPSIEGAQALCDAHGIDLNWIYDGDPANLPHKIASHFDIPAKPRVA